MMDLIFLGILLLCIPWLVSLWITRDQSMMKCIAKTKNEHLKVTFDDFLKIYNYQTQRCYYKTALPNDMVVGWFRKKNDESKQYIFLSTAHIEFNDIHLYLGFIDWFKYKKWLKKEWKDTVGATRKGSGQLLAWLKGEPTE